MLLPIGVVLLLVLRTLATPQLVIVDDQYGDQVTGAVPTHNGPSQGKVWNQGATCGDCSAKNINASFVQNGTWHDATGGGTSADYSLSYTFTGE